VKLVTCNFANIQTYLYNSIQLKSFANLTNMNKGGRPRYPIWEYFAQLQTDGKLEAMCKKCSHKQSFKVNRMKEPFKICNKSENSDSQAMDVIASAKSEPAADKYTGKTSKKKKSSTWHETVYL